MRLFVAINFDKQTKQNILNVQDRLKATGSGSFTHFDNLHLTLVFIGEGDKSKLELLKKSISQITVPKLRLEFTDTGCFKRNDGDIWWIGIKENEELSRLQSGLYDAIKNAGFVLQSSSFKPHITLARRVKLKQRADKLLEAPFTAQADAVSLMVSENVNGRLIYTELYRFGK